MAKYTIEIAIAAKDAASSILQKITTGALEQLGRKVANLATQLPRMAVELIELGAAAERQEQALSNLASSAGTSGDAIIKAIQSASDYTIDRMTAMSVASRGMIMDVADAPEEFERLTRVATALGRAMGRDAAQSIDDFVMAAARQSKLIADNLGLVIDVEQANKNYAAILGKTADALTDAEKKQAFLNAMLDAGEAKMAALGDTSLDSAGKIERAKAQLADLKVELSKTALNTGLVQDAFADLDWRSMQIQLKQLGDEMVRQGLLTEEEVKARWKEIEALGDTSKATDNVIGSLDKLIVTKREAELQVEAMTDTMVNYNQQIKDNEAALAASNQEMDGWLAAMHGLPAVVEGASFNIESLREKTLHLSTIVAEQQKLTDALARKWDQAAASIRDAAMANARLAESLMDTTATQAASLAIAQLDVALLAGTLSVIEYQGAVANLQLTYGLATLESMALGENMTLLSNQFIAGQISIGEYNAGITALLSTIPPTTAEIEAASRETERLAAEAEQAAASTGDIFVAALAEATDETDFMSMALFQAADAAGADSDTLFSLANTLGLYTGAELEAALATVVLRTALDELGEAIATGEMTMDDAIAALQDLMASMPTAVDLMRQQTGATHQYSQSRHEQAEADREAAAAQRELERAIAHTGDLFIDFLPDAAEDTDAWAMALFNAADAAGASAEALALLGGALGIYSEEQVEAALASAALQVKIEELGAALAAGTMDYEAAIERLMQFREEFLPMIAPPIQEPAGAGGSSPTTAPSFSMTVNTGAQASSVIQDFATLEALASV